MDYSLPSLEEFRGLIDGGFPFLGFVWRGGAFVTLETFDALGQKFSDFCLFKNLEVHRIAALFVQFVQKISALVHVGDGWVK